MNYTSNFDPSTSVSRLDTDPVYERQWRMSKKSVAAIHDYLGKIKRRVTVLKVRILFPGTFQIR